MFSFSSFILIFSLPDNSETNYLTLFAYAHRLRRTRNSPEHWHNGTLVCCDQYYIAPCWTVRVLARRSLSQTRRARLLAIC